MSNSIVIKKLDTLKMEEIKSAIIIMNGTELYDSVEYQDAKEKFEQDRDCITFVATVKPLYIALEARYGLVLN